jgi:hypothetical protein
MAIDPEEWLAAEQSMEQENHILLQAETTKQEIPQQPQLLMISSNAIEGTSSVATFVMLVIIGGRRGTALVDSGNTNTFMDYSYFHNFF